MASGLLQLRSMYQAALPYWYFQMVWPMEQTREIASRQPNSTKIWKLVMRSTLDSFRGGRVEFWIMNEQNHVGSRMLGPVILFLIMNYFLLLKWVVKHINTKQTLVTCMSLVSCPV